MKRMMKSGFWCGSSMLLSIGLASCGGESASTTLQPRNMSGMTGKAVFTRNGDAIEVEVSVENLMPTAALHAVHIHDIGDCGDEGLAAGPHWNPGGATTPEAHGTPGQPASHMGDIGNLSVDASGKGELIFSNPSWTLGDGAATDVFGHAVIVHEAPDDFGPVAYGNAMKRFGCGVIGVQ